MFRFLDSIDPGFPRGNPVVSNDPKTAIIIIVSIVLILVVAVLVTLLIRKNIKK